MTRHGKNCTAGAVYTYHEKKKDTAASGYGTQNIRLSRDAVKDFDCCCLSLQPCHDPVVTPDGYLYEREAILEYILHQKKEIARQMKVMGMGRRRHRQAGAFESEFTGRATWSPPISVPSAWYTVPLLLPAKSSSPISARVLPPLSSCQSPGSAPVTSSLSTWHSCNSTCGYLTHAHFPFWTSSFPPCGLGPYTPRPRPSRPPRFPPALPGPAFSFLFQGPVPALFFKAPPLPCRHPSKAPPLSFTRPLPRPLPATLYPLLCALRPVHLCPLRSPHPLPNSYSLASNPLHLDPLRNPHYHLEPHRSPPGRPPPRPSLYLPQGGTGFAGSGVKLQAEKSRPVMQA
ncbi:PREDICTED: nitric oxide synthase-interacting protein [Rhinopithecus bieti]|uniref:nitric oxide synthase-interacting protein n=1 Tax=Rhinopithecus bieti TaxID=61621 RepID=UPI00083C7DB6|nr:PREDICTED: nitric oxide synthase-interacting protein [Rhinopithecus bieti]